MTLVHWRTRRVICDGLPHTFCKGMPDTAYVDQRATIEGIATFKDELTGHLHKEERALVVSLKRGRQEQRQLSGFHFEEGGEPR